MSKARNIADIGSDDVLATTATGINVTGDITPTGGVYLGGTGAANKLDDYETGLWTPEFQGATVAGSSPTGVGVYVKVGSLVTATASFSNVTISGASGDALIVGLPFFSDSGNGQGHGGVAQKGQSSSVLFGTVNPAATYIKLRSATTTIYHTIVNSSSNYLQVTISYRAV